MGGTALQCIMNSCISLARPAARLPLLTAAGHQRISNTILPDTVHPLPIWQGMNGIRFLFLVLIVLVGWRILQLKQAQRLAVAADPH